MQISKLGAFSLVLFASSAFGKTVVKLSDVPVKVKSAIDSRFPGARYLKVELDHDDDGEKYEVHICFQNKESEVEVNQQGTITDVDAKGGC